MAEFEVFSFTGCDIWWWYEYSPHSSWLGVGWLWPYMATGRGLYHPTLYCWDVPATNTAGQRVSDNGLCFCVFLRSCGKLNYLCFSHFYIQTQGIWGYKSWSCSVSLGRHGVKVSRIKGVSLKDLSSFFTSCRELNEKIVMSSNWGYWIFTTMLLLWKTPVWTGMGYG